MGSHFPMATQQLVGHSESRISLLTPNHASCNYKGEIFLTHSASLVMRT